ncbi:unnamed protein product [Blepharisma stoltei]|uniref:Endoplasmic reticulum transmembrane protein n=1 Tax=Blepharisma stoltei TaxID=1481888 RepID=A0AAU9J9Z3_9CILI|nr:unnamed protein product [Blepharisma stoltei]
MTLTHTSDLISIIGLAFVVLQTLVYVALRFRLNFAKKAIQVLPSQIKNIGLGLILLMDLNYIFTIYQSGTGHYQAILLFSLFILFTYNSAFAGLLDEVQKANLNLEFLKKQSKATETAYMDLLGKMDLEAKKLKEAEKEKASQDQSKSKDEIPPELLVKIRMLEEQNTSLKEENIALQQENKEMRKLGISSKKNQ